MPKKSAETLCVDDLRHNEYYGMQEVFDELYSQAQRSEKFTDLMSIILKRENILLAYRNIKTNAGSNTPGTDKLTINDIGRLAPEEVVDRVRYIIAGSKHGYRPKPVRRKEIPKPNGDMRPLGIPCIWDRLVQQCIKQVMEPICEAKFSEHSYGFRPNRSVENAIAETYYRLQRSNLHYVIEFDIKGFFDNVNHSKLIRQIWSLGIQDKHLIYVLKQILKAPIRMPNGSIVNPKKGTPQGGIVSPLLANIVLNELDHWVESNWEENPVVHKYWRGTNKNGVEIKSTGYRAMRKTGLKEMYVVRYADDFRIFCRTKRDARRTMIAVTQWLSDRLKLEVSKEKTRIVNAKRKYSDFLGFKVKVQSKGKDSHGKSKYVVKSHISNKQLKRQREKLTEQAKRIAKPSQNQMKANEVRLYNSMVMGMQNYYRIATDVSIDCHLLHRAVMTVLTNRLHGKRLARKGRELSKLERERYGKSAMLRFLADSDEPIYHIGYVQCRNPMNKKRSACSYTPEGRKGLHDALRINTALMLRLMEHPSYGQSAEYTDNRISLFSAQWGRCAVTGVEFKTTDEIHCHHKQPRKAGGGDEYANLILVLEPVHVLIHATQQDTIDKYKCLLKLDSKQMKKLNELRKLAGHAEIA